jgi:hypothetical protein
LLDQLVKVERELWRTKRRNRWLLAGLGLGLCLGASIVVWALSRNTPGRYAVAAGNHAYVLDTRTGQLWLRVPGKTIYLGTNDNPKNELKEAP